MKFDIADDYPPLEMPSGNSLMELLDGLVMMYHIAAHKQLGKVVRHIILLFNATFFLLQVLF